MWNVLYDKFFIVFSTLCFIKLTTRYFINEIYSFCQFFFSYLKVIHDIIIKRQREQSA